MSADKHLFAVILAGGSGTRFWPLSRKKNPKQFLKIAGEDSLLQQTVKRISPMIPPRNILIVTNQNYRAEINRQLKKFGVKAENVLLEPEGKNTAPAILWAASLIHKRDPEAVLAVLPSDHLIQSPAAFLRRLKECVRLARKDCLVTLGIVPTRPETGYGYMKAKKIRAIHQVTEFTEKPDLAKAKRYLKTGKYYWNSGMFIWKSATVLEAFRRFLPKAFWFFENKLSSRNVRSFWFKLPNISIDYAILEKADNVVTVPAHDIGWSDLGSWESLVEVLKTDHHGNLSRGDALTVDCKDTYVHGGKRFIAAVGLEDVVVVDTDDALLICRKSDSQKVKNVVDALKKQKRLF